MGCKTCMSIAVTFFFLADRDGKSIIRGLLCEHGSEHVEWMSISGAKYSGTEIKIDGEEYTILRQNDILAIVE